ncbi:MAG: C-GCAxxG-C-C family protein [Anaerovoracaceae bacterium]|jgi:hypothetical protein
MEEELLEYSLRGYCCSQIVIDMGLRKMGRENQDMVEAAAGLCFGLNQGQNCGIVTAAMMLIFLHDPQEARLSRARDFYEWFEGTFGSIECNELLEGNPINKAQKCPMMIEAAMTELGDILEWD